MPAGGAGGGAGAAGTAVPPGVAVCSHGNACTIFKAMKAYDYSEDALKHCIMMGHPDGGSPCRHGRKCYAFARLCDGGNRLDDRCHVALYSHIKKRPEHGAAATDDDVAASSPSSNN